MLYDYICIEILNMFSNSCKYAIRSTLYLALHSDKNNKIGAKKISEQLDLPKPYLAKILQELSKRNLISSTKGRNGGFYLSEVDRQNPLEKIVEAIDGKESFSNCILGLAVCSAENPCPLHFQSEKHKDGLKEVFEKNSIQDIANQLLDKENNT
jgi:Rrf2 family protein